MELYRVLLADDEAEIRQGISRKIDWAAQGFELAGEAENGAEALELAEQIRPDVVLYGEMLNEDDLRRAIGLSMDCDLMVVAGTSLVVYPVAGLVEVPCVKRNVAGAVVALSAADMALAGIRSRIPPDEVIDAMRSVGQSMPACVRETGEGGLAATPAGERMKDYLTQG